MRKSIKAALLSGLVFPGAGHFSLSHYRRGFIFFIPTLLAMIMLIRYSLNKAYTIADQISLGKIPLDTAVITNLISTSPEPAEFFRLKIATWIIIVCWLIGIVDSFRMGHKIDQEHRA